MAESDTEVLVVDDENRLADLFSAWLGAEWSVETAYDGEGALDALSESVEVVLLDRRMPGLSGDEVLETIREEGYDVRVVMITAVDPDFDIVEMGFDDYLVKPVSKDELVEIVETVYTRSEYQADLQEYYSLTAKKALLEAEKSERELERSTEYDRLVDQVEGLGEKVDRTVSGMSDHEEFAGAFRDIPDDGTLPDPPESGGDG